MIFVDSSVWIDLFAGRSTLQVATLQELIRSEQRISTGDLIVMEVLQGARGERHARDLLRLLSRFDCPAIVGRQVAIGAAANYRSLRARGVTVRKTIDTLIATRCIMDDVALLYSDRDFDPFVEHLGLRSALGIDTGVT